MASNILGRRKEPMGSRQDRTIPKSYRSLGKLDEFADSWVQLSQTPFAQNPSNIAKYPAINYNKLPLISAIGSAYFCVPHNEKISELWDDVEDRLNIFAVKCYF